MRSATLAGSSRRLGISPGLKSIRVIDLPIHYADERILVFLPHTDLQGAEEAGRRIKRRIKRITYRGNGIALQLTASVGMSAITAGDNLTFSRLIKNASAALRAAQLKGGHELHRFGRTDAPYLAQLRDGRPAQTT